MVERTKSETAREEVMRAMMTRPGTIRARRRLSAPVRIRALLRLHADAFVRGPAATLFVLGVVLAVILSPSGLDPHDVPRMLAKGSFSRAIVMILLIGLMRGSTQRVIFPPGATYLRASAIPRWTQMAAMATFVTVAQAPLPFVLALGGAPVDALVVLVALATACMAPTSWEVALACALGHFSVLPLSIVFFAIVVRRAFRLAPIRSRARTRVRFPLFWPLQILLAHVRSLAAANVLLAALAPLIGLALVRAGDDRSDRARSLAALVTMASAAALVFRLGGIVRALRPMIRRAPVLIAVAVVATPSLAFAAGTQSIAHESALATTLSFAALLVVLEDRIASRRRDVALTWVLAAIALTVLFTLIARTQWGFLAVAIALVALAWPEPEVRRAHDL
jgi:hypothetical protein